MAPAILLHVIERLRQTFVTVRATADLLCHAILQYYTQLVYRQYILRQIRVFRRLFGLLGVISDQSIHLDAARRSDRMT